MAAPLSPLGAPAFVERLRHPRDLVREPLLRSIRAAEWAAWFQAAGVEPLLVNGMIFDSSRVSCAAAVWCDPLRWKSTPAASGSPA